MFCPKLTVDTLEANHTQSTTKVGNTAQCVELLLEGDGKSKKRIFMEFLLIFG